MKNTKTKIKKAILLVVAICLTSITMFAQTGLLWSKRYSTTGTNDHGNSIYVDALDNIYSGGAASSGGSDKMFLVKYNASGTQLWTATYGTQNQVGQEIRGIAVDAAGYIYVTGLTYVSASQGFDIALINIILPVPSNGRKLTAALLPLIMAMPLR